MHLGRGSGLDGLTGMKPLDGYLIRPLLNQSRVEIESWLKARQIAWQTDFSNAERFTIRNRIRLDVLPVWRDALGYDPAPMLCRTADHLSVDRDLLDRLAEDAYRALCQGPVRGDCPCTIDRSGWLDLHPALQIRCLRRLWRQVTGSGNDLAAVHVRMIQTFLGRARPGQTMDLPGRWRILAGQQNFTIMPAGQHPQDAQQLPVTGAFLNLPGVTILPQLSIFVDADFIENEDYIVYNSAMESFRLNAIQGCVLRLRQPGDRIHPVGRKVGKSLKKYLNELAVSPGDRARLPLIACGSEVVWLPGYTAGEGFVARRGDGGCGQLIRLTIGCLPQGETGDGEPLTTD
jgi:tRNA(Ile)-lysidine synthase